jgi:hypothetical protein
MLFVLSTSYGKYSFFLPIWVMIIWQPIVFFSLLADINTECQVFVIFSKTTSWHELMKLQKYTKKRHVLVDMYLRVRLWNALVLVEKFSSLSDRNTDCQVFIIFSKSTSWHELLELQKYNKERPVLVDMYLGVLLWNAPVNLIQWHLNSVASGFVLYFLEILIFHYCM